MASETGFTPGPWRVCDEGFVMHAPLGEWANSRTVPIASGLREDAYCGSDGTPESRANANLVAASPELYHGTYLLESLCAWLLHRFGPDSPEGKEAQFRMKKARLALAKARGEPA